MTTKNMKSPMDSNSFADRQPRAVKVLHTKVSVLLAIAALVVSPTCAIGEDRPAPPLDTLVVSSDLIVVANVLSVLPVPKKHFATAQLQVVRFIKGRLDRKQLNVIFDTSPIARHPARFKEGQRVLAFIQSPITAATFVDRERDPFASSDQLDRVFKGKYTIPFGHFGARALSDKDLKVLIEEIGNVAPSKTLDAEKLRRIEDFVGQNVSITARYSNDGANNGLLIQRLYIPVRFASVRAPNNHEVTVTGLLKRGGKFYRMDHATWKYPPGPVKVHASDVQLPELDIPFVDDQNAKPSGL